VISIAPRASFRSPHHNRPAPRQVSTLHTSKVTAFFNHVNKS
jgi:hypothetical protein